MYCAAVVEGVAGCPQTSIAFSHVPKDSVVFLDKLYLYNVISLGSTCFPILVHGPKRTYKYRWQRQSEWRTGLRLRHDVHTH